MLVNASLPSTINSTLVTVRLSEAEAETITTPETVVPLVGWVMETEGRVLSDPLLTFTETELDVPTFPAAS